MRGSRLVSTLVPVAERAIEMAAVFPATSALAAAVAYAVTRWRTD